MGSRLQGRLREDLGRNQRKGWSMREKTRSLDEKRLLEESKKKASQGNKKRLVPKRKKCEAS
jgi:hypothetical protein